MAESPRDDAKVTAGDTAAEETVDNSARTVPTTGIAHPAKDTVDNSARKVPAKAIAHPAKDTVDNSARKVPAKAIAHPAKDTVDNSAGNVPAADGAEVSVADIAAVHQLYGRQSHAIDSGRAVAWAATFTPDGQFHSPSYPEPATGAVELTAFAGRFHAGCVESGEQLRHVVSTVEVRTGQSQDTLHARAYLQIVGTPAGGVPRLHRITVLDDELARTTGGWRVRRRTVRRDG
ncbi:hypothetical protein GCM10022222_61280 [Amycolatopsis ultiminotia]|uniref:SnoaL-like domain-containing protein n=1 Tax=Amycolatopsis ultiminotia TaxID=543629 RepID=A0ABP6XLS0_9PSEU